MYYQPGMEEAVAFGLSCLRNIFFRHIGFCKVHIGLYPTGILLIYSFNFQVFVDLRGPESIGANYNEEDF